LVIAQVSGGGEKVNMNTIARISSVVLVSSFVACMQTVPAQRTGARYAALPADCPIDYVVSTSDFHAADYEPLGYVTLRQDGFNEVAKGALRPTVCEWGGTTVTIMSSAAAPTGSSATTFTIHRKRSPSAGAAASSERSEPCLGSYANTSGGSIIFEEPGKALMVFGGKRAACSTKPIGDRMFTMTCEGTASSQNASFASDCAHMNLGGMDFARAN
jgi:hypothetical protein